MQNIEGNIAFPLMQLGPLISMRPIVRTMQFLANISMVDLCTHAIAGVQAGATVCQ